MGCTCSRKSELGSTARFHGPWTRLNSGHGPLVHARRRARARAAAGGNLVDTEYDAGPLVQYAVLRKNWQAGGDARWWAGTGSLAGAAPDPGGRGRGLG